MKQSILFFAILLTIAFVACNGDVTNQESLYRAEELMVEHPDSALSLLESISPDGDEECARHALLYSQALDKNFIDVESDSIIRVALDYYSVNDDLPKYFLSLYYYGRVMYNGAKHSDAMLAYTRAEQMVDKLSDNHQIGLLYAQIGQIYSEFYDYQRSLEAFEKALEFYKCAGSEYHQRYALLDIAYQKHNMKNYAGVVSDLENLLENAYQIGDDYLRAECFRLLVSSYEALEELQKLRNLFESEFAEGLDDDLLVIRSKAVLAAIDGDVSTAKRMLEKAWLTTEDTKDSVDVYYSAYMIDKYEYKFESALQNHEKVLDIQDSIVRQRLHQPALSAQRDFFRDNAEFNAYKLKVNRYILVGVLIVVLLVLSIIVIYVRHKILAKNAEIDNYIDAVSSLQLELAGKNQAFSSKLSTLFGRQFEILDRLSNTYYETGSTKRNQEKIYEQVTREIERINGDSYSELEALVNEYKGNVMNLLRSQVELSEADYRLMCFLFSGFSAKAISVFTGYTTSKVYARKSRIKAQIVAQNTHDCERILKYLG